MYIQKRVVVMRFVLLVVGIVVLSISECVVDPMGPGGDGMDDPVEVQYENTFWGNGNKKREYVFRSPGNLQVVREYREDGTKKTQAYYPPGKDKPSQYFIYLDDGVTSRERRRFGVDSVTVVIEQRYASNEMRKATRW